jgi:Ca2+-binding RTX toxin-like protein
MCIQEDKFRRYSQGKASKSWHSPTKKWKIAQGWGEDRQEGAAMRKLFLAVMMILGAFTGVGHTGGAQLCGQYDVTMEGTDGDDNLVGTPERDVIHGLAGDDSIFALGGNDIVCGGKGYDEIVGNRGNDRLKGGSLDDFLTGRRGDDVLIGGQQEDIAAGGIQFDRCRAERERGCEG